MPRPEEKVVPDTVSEEEESAGKKETGAAHPKEVTDEEADMMNQVKNLVKDSENLIKTIVEPDHETNFTWAHFFEVHCGMLSEDALEYEGHLIAHRLSPEDCLLESLSLIVEYGQIPIGDKLKIAKTLERKQKELDADQHHKEEAKKFLGLEGYSGFVASAILGLAGGTTKYHIEYGIEQYEDGIREIKEWAALDTLKGGTGFMEGYTLGLKHSGPALQLLSSFGYRTFDYTRGKQVTTATAHKRPASSDKGTADLLCGNAELGKAEPNADSMAMYS
jgi:hypothetical protein